jgi:hypothetical protein
MNTREVVIALISSVLSGVAVWLIQQAYTNRRERRREEASKTIKSPNEERMVSEDIFWRLAPGRSVELMKQMLGVPDIFRRSDTPIFPNWGEELAEFPEPIDTHSYIYIFKNAHVKVTSKDNESIDSLTVTEADKSLSIGSLLISEGAASEKLGELKVWQGLIDNVSNHRYVRTRFDAFFALEELTGPPLHQHVTFFGYSPNSHEYEEANDRSKLMGGTIDGVCISGNQGDTYYIYEYEFR